MARLCRRLLRNATIASTAGIGAKLSCKTSKPKLDDRVGIGRSQLVNESDYGHLSACVQSQNISICVCGKSCPMNARLEWLHTMARVLELDLYIFSTTATFPPFFFILLTNFSGFIF